MPAHQMASPGRVKDAPASSGTSPERTWSHARPSTCLGRPNATSIIGCDAANGTYYQLYCDDRHVCRVYEMSIGDGKWTLWRTGEPFPQRFTASFEDNGNTIIGRWEKAENGKRYETCW